MRPLKVLSILTFTLLAISSTSSYSCGTPRYYETSTESNWNRTLIELTNAEEREIEANVLKLCRKRACGDWGEDECDLRGANLRGANLYLTWIRGDARGADLRRAYLRSANIEKVDFSGADLREARLPSVRAQKVNFSGANLRGAELFGADLMKANLSGADLRETDICGVDFREANLWETKLPDYLCDAKFEGAKTGSFNAARLRGKLNI